jgi:ClpP class serine protease
VSEVQVARRQLKALPDDHPVLRGETYLGTIAQDVGLIDGICTFQQAVEEAWSLGKEWQEAKNKQRNRALSLI